MEARQSKKQKKDGLAKLQVLLLAFFCLDRPTSLALSGSRASGFWGFSMSQPFNDIAGDSQMHAMKAIHGYSFRGALFNSVNTPIVAADVRRRTRSRFRPTIRLLTS